MQANPSRPRETFGQPACIVREPAGGLTGGFDLRSDGNVAVF